MHVQFRAIDEPQAGPKWQAQFERSWPSYRDWFLREGESERPGYVLCRSMLRRHLPELLPQWERLVDLAGGGDLPARMLSLYRPTPYLTGCSQAVWTRTRPLLVRNYDYHPEQIEGTILLSRWHDTRVIAMSDCLWGVLDGINEHGLAVSLAFGGRCVVGDGFGIPLILRYVLEFCKTTQDAVDVLHRVPSHMSYNISVLDRTGTFATVHVGPDRPTEIGNGAVATNHQTDIEWERHAAATRTLDRAALLCDRLGDPDATLESFVDGFLMAPLFQTGYARAFGTLYTAAYDPQQGRVDFLWPARSWRQSFARFDEGEMTVHYRERDGE
jgi:predicted choloylglycine hydrolase